MRQWGGTVEIFSVLLYGPLMTGLLAGLFYRVQRELAVSRRSAVAASLLLGLCSYPALQSSYFLRHTSEGVAVLAGAIERLTAEVDRCGNLLISLDT